MLYKTFSVIELGGNVLDVGGSRRADYHRLFKGSPRFYTANLDVAEKPDILCDLEKGIPAPGEQYDGIISLNTIEHLYDARAVLKEMFRVLKPGGAIVVAVPFLVQIHPSPRDYARYSGESLERFLKEAGFNNIKIVSIGRGPFTACSQILHNTLAIAPLRIITYIIAMALDSILLFTARLIGRTENFGNKSYPLGFLVTAVK
ncbi:MAG: methyltransferase domain-containing protein [Patescibacteria group bacterium]